MLFKEIDLPGLLSQRYSSLRLQYPRGETIIAAVTALSILAAAYLILLVRSVEHLPESLPWAGRRNESFSKIRAAFREYSRGWASLKEGQERVSKPSQRRRTLFTHS